MVGGSSLKGGGQSAAVASLPVASACLRGRPWIGGKPGGGGRCGARGVLAKEEKRGGEKGERHQRCLLSVQRAACGKRGEGQSPHGREIYGRREGGPSAAASTGPWPTGAGVRRSHAMWLAPK
jgi:hypothetical protein